VGYGAGAAPPPPPSEYGAPPAGAGGYSPIEAMQYGWAKFTKGPATLLVPALLVLVVLIVIDVVVQIILRSALLGTHDCTRTVLGTTIHNAQCGPGFFTTIFVSALGGLVASFIGQLLGAGLIKSALNLVDGKPVNAGDVFGYATKPNVVTTAALVAGATFVGTLLCYLPGLVVGFLTLFAMFFVVDKDMAPMDAIKASFSLTTSKFGETILFYLLGIVVIVIGAILCLVGLLAAVPVVLAGAAYTFRLLNNEPVTPAT
jgi:uncharacterized membrane protein